MLQIDEDALICDLAETYHIFEYKNMKPSFIATLACGLRENSRIFKKMGNYDYDPQTLLLSLTVDCLRMLIWQNSKDGQKNRNKPKPLLQPIKQKQEEIATFTNGADFESVRKRLLKEVI